MYKFGNRSLQTLKGVHPYLAHIMLEALRDAPVDFTLTDGVRTEAEQAKLYAQGRTTPGKIVTNVDGKTRKSNHQPKADGYGYALDLYPFVGGSVDLHDKGKNMDKLAAHILATAKRLGYSLVWGGNWTGLVDRPHFELK